MVKFIFRKRCRMEIDSICSKKEPQQEYIVLIINAKNHL